MCSPVTLDRTFGFKRPDYTHPEDTPPHKMVESAFAGSNPIKISETTLDE
jgi:hypothetical protein